MGCSPWPEMPPGFGVLHGSAVSLQGAMLFEDECSHLSVCGQIASTFEVAPRITEQELSPSWRVISLEVGQ